MTDLWKDEAPERPTQSIRSLLRELGLNLPSGPYPPPCRIRETLAALEEARERTAAQRRYECTQRLRRAAQL